MDNVFRVLCVFSSEDVQSEFKKIVDKLQEKESTRIDSRKISIEYYSRDKHGDNYDIIVADLSEKENDLSASMLLLNLSEEFNHSQIILICSLNLKDYSELSLAIKDTRTFSFGTELEAINRIVNMQYLFEKELHLL